MKLRAKDLDDDLRLVHGDFVMLIVRQPKSEPMRGAFAPRGGRLFGVDYTARITDSRICLHTAHVLEQKSWRGG